MVAGSRPALGAMKNKKHFIFIKDLDCDGLCVILTPDNKYMICEWNCLEDLDGNFIELESIKEFQKLGEPPSALLIFRKEEFFSVINKLNEIKRL